MKKFVIVMLLSIMGASLLLIAFEVPVQKAVDTALGKGVYQRLEEDVPPPSGPAVKAISLAPPAEEKKENGEKGKAEGKNEGEEEKKVAAGSTLAGEQEARRAIDEARDLLKKGDVAKARAVLHAALDAGCSEPTGKKIKRLLTDAVPLFQRLFEIQPQPTAGFVEISLESGGKLRGWIVGETEKSYTVKMEDGGQLQVEKEYVTGVKKFSSDELMSMLMREYARRRDAIPEGDVLGEYDLAVFCRRKGLTDLAAKHLMKALDAQPGLAAMVDERDAKQLYALGVWFASAGNMEKAKTYRDELARRHPGSKYISMLEEDIANLKKSLAMLKSSGGAVDLPPLEAPIVHGSLPEPEKTTPAPIRRTSAPPQKKHPSAGKESQPTHRAAPAASSGWESKGDEYYRKGVALYREAVASIGKPAGNTKSKQAMDAFAKAVEYYTRAKKEGTASQRIDAKITQANSLKYGCFKMMHL